MSEVDPRGTQIESDPPPRGDSAPVAVRRKVGGQLLVTAGLAGLLVALLTAPVSDAFRSIAAEHYASRAEFYLGEGDTGAALANVERALEWLPENPALIYLRAQVLAHAKDFQASLADYNRLIELAPGFAAAYYQRALIYHELSCVPEAIADLDRAVELSPPGDATALINRAYVRAFDNVQVAEARHDVQRARDITGASSPALLHASAFVHFREGNLDAARNDITLAIQANQETRKECREQFNEGEDTRLKCSALDRTLGRFEYLRSLIEMDCDKCDEAEKALQCSIQLGYEPPQQSASAVTPPTDTPREP